MRFAIRSEPHVSMEVLKLQRAVRGVSLVPEAWDVGFRLQSLNAQVAKFCMLHVLGIVGSMSFFQHFSLRDSDVSAAWGFN